MSKQRIHVGTESAERGFKRFKDAWHRAEQDKLTETEVHLNYKDLPMLLAILTPRRLEILKVLRQQGPLSVRALALKVDRNYKNVHTDMRELETAGLLERTEEGTLHAPWDVIDAHLSLVA